MSNPVLKVIECVIQVANAEAQAKHSDNPQLTRGVGWVHAFFTLLRK